MAKWQKLTGFGKLHSRQGWQPRHLVMLFAIGGTTLVVGVTALIGYSVVRERILENLKQNALLKVQRKADEIDEWLAIQKTKVETIANSPTVQTKDWSVVAPYLDAEAKRSEEFYDFALVNPDGSYSITNMGRVQTKSKDPKTIQKALAGSVYVSDPVTSPRLGTVVIPVLAPIRSTTSQQPIGAISGNISLKRLTREVNSLNYSAKSYTFALNSEGVPIVAPNQQFASNLDPSTLSLLKAKNPTLAKVANQMVNQQSEIIHVNLDGRWVYIAYLPLQQVNWSLALVIPSEVIESKLVELHLLALMVGGLLAIATTIALRQVLLFEQTRARAEREALLNRLTARIRASLELEQILQTTVEELATLLNLKRVAYAALDSQHQTLEIQREYCKSGMRSQLGQFDCSILADLELRLQQGEAIFLNRSTAKDALDDVQIEGQQEAENSVTLSESPLQLEAKSYLTQAVRYDSITLGYLLCICSANWEWSDEEKELLQAVADSLAIAITQSQLYSQIQSSEAEQRALLEAITDTVIVFNSQGQYLKYLQKNPALIYKPTAQRIGKTVQEVLPRQQAEQILDSVHRALFAQTTVRVEYYLPIGGKKEWFSATVSPFMTDHVLFVSRNITDRKRAELALQKAEEKYRSIFENAVEGIFQTTPQGHYLSANPALARIYGYNSPQDLMSQQTNIAQQLYVDSNRRTEFMAAMEQHQALSNFESQVYRQDGSIIWISENARAVRDEQGRLLYYEGIIEDITQRKLAEEALRAEQEKSERLLLNILPKVIADQLKQNSGYLAERFEDATVLFADIVGFTPMSARISPEE
ncbi:MAG TPA: PAS domain S-box protein, partial [Coleofasciculaceae cyanobacterium]